MPAHLVDGGGISFISPTRIASSMRSRRPYTDWRGRVSAVVLFTFINIMANILHFVRSAARLMPVNMVADTVKL